jgi:hypothetical protein
MLCEKELATFVADIRVCTQSRFQFTGSQPRTRNDAKTNDAEHTQVVIYQSRSEYSSVIAFRFSFMEFGISFRAYLCFMTCDFYMPGPIALPPRTRLDTSVDIISCV